MSVPTAFDFWKMHGAGNDFVLTEVAPGVEAPDAQWGALARAVCDRHFGVGADGLILVLPSTVADRRMRIFNADGSEAEMCGNGIRCFVKFVLDRALVSAPAGTLRVQTVPGVLEARATRGAGGSVERVRVAMGAPAFRPQDLGARVEQPPPVIDLPLEAAGEALRLTLVSMGNPHAVHFIDREPAGYDLARIGPAVEHHPLFAHRTNFEVVRVLDRGHVEMRVWERGVGETLACGSGACAAAVAARLHGDVADAVAVRTPGGTLHIEWDGRGVVWLEGPATQVFAARWERPAVTSEGTEMVPR
ncbi:MAG: diaminopimelate epimerase [Dehalococcoidia bacterium]|nr:diaminopimelate epimerase [Dehalococcoidia bacterium]